MSAKVELTDIVHTPTPEGGLHAGGDVTSSA